MNPFLIILTALIVLIFLFIVLVVLYDMWDSNNYLGKFVSYILGIILSTLVVYLSIDLYKDYKEPSLYHTRIYSCDGITIQGEDVKEVKPPFKANLTRISYLEDRRKEVSRECYNLQYEEKQ